MNGRRAGGRVAPLVLGAAALGLFVLIALVAGRGQDPDAVPTPQEVRQRIMSPFCPGLTLEECPSGQAAELRRRIAERVEDGATNREIDDWLVATYGEGVLGRPRSVISWLAPAAAVLAGALLLVAGLRRRARPADEEPAAPIPEEDRDRLLADLRSFAEGGTE